MAALPMPDDSGAERWWEAFSRGVTLAGPEVARLMKDDPWKVATMPTMPAINEHSQNPEQEGIMYAIGEAIKEARKRVKP